METPEKYSHIDFKPPQSVQKEAQKILDLRDEHGDEVKGGTRVGWTRANQLAKGEKLSPKTIQRMYSFFSRHKGNKSVDPKHKDTPWKDNGWTAWMIWGGDAGKKWTESTYKQIEKADREFEDRTATSIAMSF